jgi:hypothetical protein
VTGWVFALVKVRVGLCVPGELVDGGQGWQVLTRVERPLLDGGSNSQRRERAG